MKREPSNRRKVKKEERETVEGDKEREQEEETEKETQTENMKKVRERGEKTNDKRKQTE